MKPSIVTTWIAAAALAVAAAGCSKEEAAPRAATGSATAPKGTVYGAGVSVPETVPISRIHDEAEALDGKRVRVEGTITAVCPNRGCWIDIAGDRPSEVLRVKVRDGEIVFPASAKGKRVVAEGIVRKLGGAPPAGGAGHACGPGEDDGHGHGGGHAGEGHGGEKHHDCAAPAQASARLDGTGAVIVDGT